MKGRALPKRHQAKAYSKTHFSRRGSAAIRILTGNQPLRVDDYQLVTLAPPSARMHRVPLTMFKAAKDAMTSRAAQVYVNGRIARYGEVQTLRINSSEKTMEVSCLLHGESDPIRIKVENYTVNSTGAKKYIEASTITCSRPWLQNLLADFAQNRRIELPNWAESIL